MAKKSAIDKNKKKIIKSKRHEEKRKVLKRTIMDKSISQEERFAAVLKLSALPRDGSRVRVRNRCTITGRPRGNYRKFGLSRIKLRELSMTGDLPGVVKSSW